jgi:hypothetical protein
MQQRCTQLHWDMEIICYVMEGALALTDFCRHGLRDPAWKDKRE